MNIRVVHTYFGSDLNVGDQVLHDSIENALSNNSKLTYELSNIGWLQGSLPASSSPSGDVGGDIPGIEEPDTPVNPELPQDSDDTSGDQDMDNTQESLEENQDNEEKDLENLEPAEINEDITI